MLKKLYYDKGGMEMLKKINIDKTLRFLLALFRDWGKGRREVTFGNKKVSFLNWGFPKEKNFESEKKVLDDLIKEVEKTDVLWDVGADIGLYSCVLDKKINDGNVISFEPHPVRRSRLRRNIKINKSRVIVRSEALSNIKGSLKFDYSLENEKDSGKFEVEVDTAENMVDEKNMPTPNIVKIDVEGAELNVIKGMKSILGKKECRMIYVELHQKIENFGGSWSNLKSILESENFLLKKIETREGKFGTQEFIKAKKR